MTATVDDDRRTQMAFIRTLVERAVSQVEGLLRQTDPEDARAYAPFLVQHMLAEILHDRHGASGPDMFLDAANFAAETIKGGNRLTLPKGADHDHSLS